MNSRIVSSDRLPVSGSMAVTSNGSARAQQRASAVQSWSRALTCCGSRPGVAIEMVAPGSVVPRAM
jgi:hypothetical protein